MVLPLGSINGALKSMNDWGQEGWISLISCSSSHSTNFWEHRSQVLTSYFLPNMIIPRQLNAFAAPHETKGHLAKGQAKSIASTFRVSKSFRYTLMILQFMVMQTNYWNAKKWSRYMARNVFWSNFQEELTCKMFLRLIAVLDQCPARR